MKTIYYAIQNIIRGKDSTIIKVVSLSLGLFLSIVLFARVAMELSYDTFYQGHKQLHFVQTLWDFGKGGNPGIENSLYPTGPTIMQHFPEQVESATVINSWWPVEFKHGERIYNGKDFLVADSLFFQTMGIPLLEGNAKDLGMRNVIFMSQSFAREVFGNENPVGKALLWNGKEQAIVKGIYADIPENNTFRGKAVLSMASLDFRKDWFSGGSVSSVVRLKEGADMNFINERINPILANYIPMEEHYTKLAQAKGIKVSLTPMDGYHLSISKVRTMLYILSLLGFVLLISAAFNYALISISSLAHRAKAIGVHKCSGAENGSIFAMFFWETSFVVFISVVISVFLILNLNEQIEEVMEVSTKSLFSWNNLWAPLLAIVILFIIGCILPGRLFSSIPVTQVFRRYTEGKKRWKYPLLCMQFGGTAFLLGIVAMVSVQYHYVMHKDMGYDTKGLVYINHSFSNPQNALTNLRNLPFVEGAENASTQIMNPIKNLSVEDNNGNWKFTPRIHYANEDFCKLIKLRLLAGKYHTRPGEIVVNPELVELMDWTSDGIGEVIPNRGTVVGIVEFIEINKTKTSPYWIHWPENEEETSSVHVRLKEPIDENLLRLNEEMKKLYPQEDILFRPVEDSLHSYFRSARIFRNSSMIACMGILVITLMGVIGYTNDEIRRRSKEIAIRKVNGAEVNNILQMLCRDVAIIALPAVVIGVLLSAYIGDMWVSSNFRDILAISPLVYIGVVILALAFILGTVILKSWRIANENPVISIKSE